MPNAEEIDIKFTYDQITQLGAIQRATITPLNYQTRPSLQQIYIYTMYTLYSHIHNPYCISKLVYLAFKLTTYIGHHPD
jgi:hypothetical protein